MATQPQPNTAQLAKMIENLQKRVDAKTLECASLDTLRKTGPAVLSAAIEKVAGGQSKSLDAVNEAAYNYLTAKLNQELVTLEEYEIQLRGWKSALAQMQSGILLPSGVKVGGRG